MRKEKRNLDREEAEKLLELLQEVLRTNDKVGEFSKTLLDEAKNLNATKDPIDLEILIGLMENKKDAAKKVLKFLKPFEPKKKGAKKKK